jgi:hypothetical protein
MIPLITSHNDEPLRFINNQAVRAPTDPTEFLNDELEQFCALKQDEVTTRERDTNPALVLGEKMFELKTQITTELDRLISILQLLTQNKWGTGENIRFLNVRAGTSTKDPPCTLDIATSIDELCQDISQSQSRVQKSLSQSQEFADVLISLRSLWPIEEKENKVTVDLLPLRNIIKSESPYLASIFVDRTPLERGVCISIPASICCYLRSNCRLSVVTNSDTGHHATQRHPPTTTSRAAALDQTLAELQDLCMHYAAFQAVKKEAEAIAYDVRRWAPMACGENEIAFADLCGRSVSALRVVVVRYHPSQAHTFKADPHRQALLGRFVTGQPLLAGLLA